MSDDRLPELEEIHVSLATIGRESLVGWAIAEIKRLRAEACVNAETLHASQCVGIKYMQLYDKARVEIDRITAANAAGGKHE